MGQRLKGKVALITGGGTGIGKAAAEKMLKEGAAIAILGLHESVIMETVNELKEISTDVIGFTADVSKTDDMEQAVRTTVDRFGRLDILVNNAALQIMGDLINMKSNEISQVLDVNLKGSILASKYALPVMKSQGSGSIIHISSVLGLVGDPDLAVYGSTKGGLIALCKSMAVAYGPYGIRVNCICPGDVNTPMVKDYFDHQPNPEAARTEIYNHYPLRRIAEPSEVANAIAFLASDEASFISGTQLLVDGGLSAEVY